jgi:dTDP-glucose 4,6-dehydratase
MRLLVTGGAGFIGSNFVNHWVKTHPGDELVVLDALTYAATLTSLEAVRDRIGFVEGDIGDPELVQGVLEREGTEVIVHFAAESHNSLAVLEPGRFFRTNVVGTQTLLEAARQAKVGRFHHVSTCEVYGDLDPGSTERVNEESPFRPNTPYSASKAGAELAVRAYHRTYGLPVTVTNCCNNYGPYQFPEKLISLFVTNALDHQPLPLYASSWHAREWLHVADHCRAIEAVLEEGQVGETYHVGSGREATIEEVADLVLSATERPSSLKTMVPDRPGHDRRYLLDSSKIRHQLGWEPKVDFESGLSATASWYADHRSWWEPLRGRAPVVEAAAWTSPAPTSP